MSDVVADGASAAPERLRYLFSALSVARTLTKREVRPGRAPVPTTAADEFYSSLVRETLDGIDDERDALA